MSHWFFLSYARENLDDYLRKFYRDLNEAIRSLTRPGEGEDGFFDERSIGLGERWPEDLTTALQNCRAFISLYSPAYFAKEACGREWQVFSRRQAEYNADSPPTADFPPLLLPVLWVPEERLPNPLPAAVSKVQYNYGDFGKIYAQKGLQQMMRVSKYRDHYWEFLAKFAETLVKAASSHTLPPDPHLLPFNEIKSAFHPSEAELKPHAESINFGPRYVQFVFVAGRREELRTVRKKLEPYGEKGGLDWHPYLPETPEEVGIIAQRITADEQFHYDSVQIDDSIIKRIEDAERQNNIVAIVVDTWTLCLPRYNTSMREYDRRKFLNCVVLVSWNDRDDETETKRSALTHELNTTFLRNCIQRDPNCFLEISSHDELRRELPAALHKALQRIAEKAKVVKKAESEERIRMPQITGVTRRSE